MSIKFLCRNGKLYLIYNPDNYDHEDGNEWVEQAFEIYGKIDINNTFTFTRDHIRSFENEIDFFHSVVFLLGAINGKYFRIDKNILQTNQDVYIDEKIIVQKRIYADVNAELLPAVKSLRHIFTAYHNISIFYQISKLHNEESIFIGGENPSAIPLPIFNILIAKFPNVYERKRFAIARITNILQEYIPSMLDGELLLQRYFQHKENRLRKHYDFPKIPVINIPSEMFESEIQKFYSVAKIVRYKLENDSEADTEENWQKLITTILPLIFPQYVAILPKVTIKESYSKEYDTNRQMDFVLVNANGYIDILEIKKPFASCILRKTEYRDNYIPTKELSGSVMQVEKYIYYLNSLTKFDEDEMTNKYQNQLPAGLKIKIRNPKGLILLGRSHEFSPRQHSDFEFIKRKYSNITDILSYDDFLNRIDNIINAMKKKQSGSP